MEIVMADRVDNYFTDYYSGMIDMQIALREKALLMPTTVDENIGGGRAENKQNRIVDNMMIIKESDYTLQSYMRDKWVMDQFVKVLTDEERALLELKFNRQKKRSWLQIASILSKSVSQCKRDLVKIKQRYKTSIFVVDNL